MKIMNIIPLGKPSNVTMAVFSILAGPDRESVISDGKSFAWTAPNCSTIKIFTYKSCV